MNHTALEDIYTELCSVYENIKAEVLIAEIQENSDATLDEFVISNRGTFSRAYRRDIINVDEVLHDNRLTLNLSRNGLYDILPEGMFHEPHINNGGDSYTARRKVAKEEEQDARLFFAPLENEFFNQRLKIEQNERALLDDFYNLKDDFLINFWNLNTNIPDQYLLKLIKLLPYSYKVAGDLELTRLCLVEILGERVSFNRKYIDQSDTAFDRNMWNSEDGFQLGVNSILEGDRYEVLSQVLEVTIGPVSKTKASSYLDKSGTLTFIETFYDYFLPLELEADTKITVKNDIGFLLDEAQGPIMGFSTYI